MSLKARWLLVLAMLTIPYVVLAGAGGIWLWERGLALWYLLGAVVLAAIGWPLLRSLERQSLHPADKWIQGSPNWSRRGQAAWQQVEEIAHHVDVDAIPLDKPEPMIDLGRRVLEAVAREFHPKSRQPLLETPVPHLLRVLELVTHDLREALSSNVPGSHILTIHDLQRLQKLVGYAPTMYRLYRLIAFVVSPQTGIAREINTYLQGEMMNASTQETKRWALDFAVRKIGWYAIELYSGNLVVQDIEFRPFTSAKSRDALSLEEKRDASLASEPLRILVVGQVKAGKSSLINALFGEMRAAIDVVPRTKHVEPYLLERDGLQRAVILDTAGYEDVERAGEALSEAREAVLQSDLILLAVSARSAARDADRRLLTEIRTLFQSDPDREFPPLVVVLTQIDQLRPFREWNPPYDIVHPGDEKARNIRDAMDAVATDLQVDISQIVPACGLPERLYNIEEGVVPTILNSLSAAQRLRYLRCLREMKDEDYWNRLRDQAANTGRILLRAGMHVLGHAGRKFDALTERFEKRS